MVSEPSSDEAEWKDVLALLDNARIVIWFCPDTENEQHRAHPKDKPTVEWADDEAGMTPHCLVCGKVGATR
jgi:hypothetical protein